MDDTGKTYFNQELWTGHDVLITENNFSVSTSFYNDDYNLSSATNLSLMIRNFKRKSRNNISLSHKDVFLYLVKAKPLIDSLDSTIASIMENKNIQKTFTFSSYKKIHTTIMWRNEYDISVRICITENKDENFDDSEKFYMSYTDYMSLVKILVGYRDNYMSLCSNNIVVVNNHKMMEKFDLLSSKLTGYFKDLKLSNIKQEMTSDQVIKMGDIDIPLPPSAPVEIVKTEEEKNNEVIQNDFSDYLNNNISNINISAIDAFKEREKNYEEKKETAVTIDISSAFTTKFMNNNILTLEKYLMASLTDKNTFSSLVGEIAKKLEISPRQLFNGCSDSDFYSISYLSTRLLKYAVNNHLDKKMALPPNVVPIVFANGINNPINIDVMYDLFLYFTYYTNLKNQIIQKDKNTSNNREMVCFILKNILSPLIFSYIKYVPNRETMTKEIINRYRTYRELGVFNELQKELMSKYGNAVDVSELSITEYVNTIYEKAIPLLDTSFAVKQCFMSAYNRNDIKLSYDVFNSIKMDAEKLQKILILESNYMKNDTINENELGMPISEFSDLGSFILKGYSFELVINTDNLKRFVNEMACENKLKELALEIVSKIKTNYTDLKEYTFDYSLLPEAFLKALCIWDIDNDRQLSLNYTKFKDKVENSNLTKTLTLSLLGDISVKKTSDFMNCMAVSAFYK